MSARAKAALPPTASRSADTAPAQRDEPVLRVTSLVLVRTPIVIGGQNEHAAIVTRLHGNDVVDVTLLPAGAEPYPVSRIQKADDDVAGLCWRFPD